MIGFNIWIILVILSIVLLIFYWKSKNAVWGGLTMGIILGLIIVIYYLFQDNSFNWYIIGKSAVVGTIIGFGADLLGRASNYLRNRK